MLPKLIELHRDRPSSSRRVRHLAVVLIVTVCAQLLPLLQTATPVLASTMVKPKTPFTMPMAMRRFASSPLLPQFPPREEPLQQPGNGDENPFLQLFPELAQAPAPDWLQEGTRVTYRVQTAQIAKTPDDLSNSGESFVQYDLVALDHQSAIASVKSYIDDLGLGAAIPSFLAVSRGIPGVGDYWLSPTVLPNANKVAGKGLTVANVPLTLGSTTYNGVRFQSTHGGTETVWIFDEASGLLLYYSSITGDQRIIGTLEQERALTIPWTTASVPDWVNPNATLRYKGTYSVQVQGSPELPTPFSLIAQVRTDENLWTEFTITTSLNGQPNATSASVTGIAQLSDGYWLSAQAIDGLADGQVIDNDPVTGAEIAVSRPGNGFITLMESGSAYQTASTYSENDGALVSFAQQINTSLSTIVVKLQLTDRQ